MRKMGTFEHRTKILRRVLERLKAEDNSAIKRMRSSTETTTNRRQIEERLRALQLYAEVNIVIGRQVSAHQSPRDERKR